MTDKTLAITGPTSGIGRAATERLAEYFDVIILLARNTQKAEAFKADLIRRHDHLIVDIVECDLSSLVSVETAADYVQLNHDKIDCLINNAGVVSLTRQQTEDGFEMMMGTNYIGHYLLTHHLIKLVMNSREKQIVIVGSNAYAFTTLKKDYFTGKGNPMHLYGRSKLATLYFMQELHEQFSKDGLYVTAVHPGAVSTNLGKTSRNQKIGNIIYGALSPFFVSPDEGTESTIMAVREKEKWDGKYMHNDEEIIPKAHGQSYYIRKQLIRNTMAELNLDTFM